MHRIVKKTKVASEPEALGNSFGVPGITVKQIGVEAGPLLQWLHAGLKRAGFDAILLETVWRRLTTDRSVGSAA